MILGILFTSSNAEMRANKLYDLIRPDLQETISPEDIDQTGFFPLMGQLSHCIIIEHYNDVLEYLNDHFDEIAKVSPQYLNMDKWEPIPPSVFEPVHFMEC